MKLDVLQKFINRLQIPDNDLLRRSGLVNFSKEYQAYPLVQDNRQFCVLLPRGTPPRVAAKFDPPQLMQRVVVLEQKSTQWNRVFPVESSFMATTGGELLIVDDEV